MKKAYNITELCNVFDLPSSSYYYKPVDLNKKYATMIAKIKDLATVMDLHSRTISKCPVNQNCPR